MTVDQRFRRLQAYVEVLLNTADPGVSEMDCRSDADEPAVTDGGPAIRERHDESDASAPAVDFDDEKLLNGIGLPLFMLDGDGNVIAWNERIERLTGSPKADVVGTDSVATVLYPAADQTRTLAERVLQDPEGAHERSGVTLSDEGLQIYERERSVPDRSGDTRHFECSARPLYQDGDLAAVLQTVQDRTDEVRRHDAISGLVSELSATFTAIADGDLGARAQFDDASVDDTLLAVVDDVNAMADELESLTERVDAQADVLAELGERSTEAATRIDSHVSQQRVVLDDVGEEIERFSANMEEVAASADQIAASADDAQDAAEDGREAGQRARQATDDVLDASSDLVETVTALETSVDDVEEILAVIDDVAEQTNMLALNASIESARAGKAGDGFGVVADEIKELAAQTRDHTEAIDESIGEIQEQAGTATDAVEDSHTRVQQAGDEIDDALTALNEIAATVNETATGVQQVADANDQQATTVQEVLSMVEDTRDHADTVEASSDEIVRIVEEQQSEIDELQARVQSLSRSG